MSDDLIVRAAAKAMVLLGMERRAAGKPMPTRIEEARVALAAADCVRHNQTEYQRLNFGPELP